MIKPIDWLSFILYMKMKEKKRNSWMYENDSTNRLAHFHTIYENEKKEKK
jgi:hypothetical protein